MCTGALYFLVLGNFWGSEVELWCVYERCQTMKKNEIEAFISPRLNAAIGTAIRKGVEELNSKGCRFEPVNDLIQEWVDQDSGYQLSIHCALGVHVAEEPDPIPVEDPVMDSFYARIDSGSDPEAEMLSLMEGDISNGGFHQLYDNKGVDFIEGNQGGQARNLSISDLVSCFCM